jgi:hypothetical protein
MKPKRSRKSPNVPAQALGYSLQFTRMAAMLFESGPGGLVSFEVFDDVGEDSADGTRTPRALCGGIRSLTVPSSYGRQSQTGWMQFETSRAIL